MDSLHHLRRDFPQRLLRLLGGYLHRLRQARHQIPASDVHIVNLRPLVGRTDLDLEILCCSLTDQKIVLLTHIPYNGFVEIIPCNLDGSAYHRAAKGNHCDIRRAAADVHDHVPAGLRDIDARADSCRNGLFNDVHLPCACLIGSILHSLLLHLGDSAGNTHRNPGLSEGSPAQCLLDEIFHHLLRHGIVGDDSLAQRPYRNDVAGGSAQHQPRVLPDGLDLVGISVECYYGGLLQNNALSSDVY